MRRQKAMAEATSETCCWETRRRMQAKPNAMTANGPRPACKTESAIRSGSVPLSPVLLVGAQGEDPVDGMACCIQAIAPGT